MAIVQLTISALPAHVRTARLMATAVARRAGIAESALDEVRLAVGEACSRAVEAHRVYCPEQPIQLKLIDSAGPPGASSARGRTVPSRVNGGDPGRFQVVISDRAPAKEPSDGAPFEPFPVDPDLAHLEMGSITPPGGVSGMSPDVGLAVIVGLADEVNIEPKTDGTVVTMSWPLNRGGSDDEAAAAG